MANETEVVEVRLPILPKGYRYTGEYRYAQQGELIMPRNDVFPWERVVESDYLHHIIEKIEWVPCLDEKFWTIDAVGDVIETECCRGLSHILTGLIEAGNYFKTYEIARNAAIAYRMMLKGCRHE